MDKTQAHAPSCPFVAVGGDSRFGIDRVAFLSMPVLSKRPSGSCPKSLMRDLPEPTTPRTPKVARKRIPWSPEQEQTLIGGVQDGHAWGDISSKLERRNNQDVAKKHQRLKAAREAKRESIGSDEFVTEVMGGGC